MRKTGEWTSFVSALTMLVYIISLGHLFAIIFATAMLVSRAEFKKIDYNGTSLNCLK